MMRHHGFTLIELMVSLLIIGILTALAYPSYQAYIVRGKRAQGQAALLQLMQQQERYFSQNNSYLAFSFASTDPHEKMFQWWSGVNAAQSAYEIEGVACAGDVIALCVELRAMPGTINVDKNFRDADCGTLILSSTGRHAAGGTAKRCWP